MDIFDYIKEPKLKKIFSIKQLPFIKYIQSIKSFEKSKRQRYSQILPLFFD